MEEFTETMFALIYIPMWISFQESTVVFFSITVYIQYHSVLVSGAQQSG